MKKFNLFKMLAVLIVLITSINTAWAKSVHLYNGYIKASFNGNNCWSSNWYGMYSGGPNASLGTAEYMGVLTGDFIITDCKMKINSDYEVLTSQHKFWCNVDGSGGYQEYIIYWNKSNGDGYPEANSINKTVARSTDPSGDHSINVGFNSKFEESYGNWELDQNLQTYYFSYKVLPPNVSDFTVASSGNILSGTGTEDDPFIISKNGSLTLTSSGGTQAHTDGNSSIQFSKDNSNWGTTSDYTVKTISNITTTDRTAVNVYARYYNSASCIGAVKTKTYYYKTAPWSIAGTMNNWDTDNQPIAHISSGTGYVDINLNANTTYTFKVKDRTQDANSGWYGYNTALGYGDSGIGKTFSTSGNNCSITTAGAGSYRFTWNGSSTLTVTYPTSYTVTFGYGTGGSEVTATGSGSGSIESGKYVKSGENVTFTQTNATGYTFKGWYTTADGNTTVSTMGVSDNILNGIGGDKTVYAQYTPNEHTITLTPGLSPSTGTTGTESVTVTYNASTNLTGTITTPTREGYTFAGYEDASHNLVIDEDGDFTTAGDYIDGDDKWIVDDDLTLTAKWTDNGTYVFTGGAWNTASNWTKGVVPGSSADVILLADAATPSGTTTVNSIRIATSGTYTPVGGDGITANGSLTVSAGSALKVTTSVQNCVISANAPTSVGSTTSSTLDIRSGGALAWGGTDPGDATVQFTTRSGGAPGSNKAVNQYFGIPFTSMNSSVFDDAWVFAVSGSTWAEINNATMAPFTGYNIILQLEKDADSHFQSYGLTGTLVGRGASLGSGVTAGTETLYANSWVSPIKISEIGFSGTGTIYIFSAQSAESIVSESNPVGNYTPYTINNSSGSYIPSMQSFSIISGTSISIDYATAVYGEITGGQVNYAPRRNHEYDYREAIWATQDTLTLDVKGANGWSDKLKMFIHEDFSQDYENGWDGPKMEGMWEAPKLYTLNNEGQMAVSCVPSADNSVIAFHAGTASNEYTFMFKYSGEEALVLKDTKTGVETPIEDGGTYEFTSNTSDDDLRFVIKKVSNAATGVDEIGGNASGVQKIMYNGTMYILREGRIYSAEGAFVK